MAAPDVDVALIGYGPTGELAANLLGAAGRRVAVLERAPEIYDLPRAVHFDDEIMRIFQQAGLAEEVVGITRSLDGAEFVTADGERLVGLDAPADREYPRGWPPASFFYQPELDALLRRGAERFPDVEVRLACEVTGLETSPEAVRLSLRDASGAESSLTARFALGCDGAASSTRRRLGIGYESLGFDQEWLVIDALLLRDVALPTRAQQICDPERPATFVPSVGRHRRWEFQRKEGETREELERPERVLELLSPWVAPDEVRVIRAVVYEFHACIAERWRAGRVLLAGDAAHQMPPFLGQGMCSGLRDVANLVWKLELVLDGLAPESLLGSYQAERGPHVRDVVEWAVAVGKLIDAFSAAAAGRAAAPGAGHRQSGYGGGRQILGLRHGLLQAGAEPDSPVGKPLPQPRVRTPAGTTQLLDELLGARFAVIARDDPKPALGPAAEALVARLGVGLHGLADLGRPAGQLAELLERYAALIVRPDRYVYAALPEPADLDPAFAELGAALGMA